MRLTNNYRDQIIQRCLAARFADATKQYEAARTVLADALYDHAFGDAEPIARRLPAGWLSSMSTVYISCEGFCSRYRNSEDMPANDLKLSRERLKPGVIDNQFSVNQDHPLFPKAQAVVAMFNAIKSDKDTLSRHLTSLVYSVSTREKLLEVWPEGEPYFPPVVQNASVPIPYDLTLSINRMMGITSTAGAAA